MKEFNCSEVLPGCRAQFSLFTTDEILDAVAEHARHDHGMAKMPQSLVEKIRACIRVAA